MPSWPNHVCTNTVAVIEVIIISVFGNVLSGCALCSQRTAALIILPLIITLLVIGR